MYKNERASVQLVTYDEEEAETAIRFARAEVTGELNQYVTLHTVESVINYLPAFGTAGVIEKADPTFLRTAPGMYPDILLPLMRKGHGVPILNQQLHSVVLDIEGDLAAGTYPLTLSLYSAPTPDRTAESELLAENTIEVEVCVGNRNLIGPHHYTPLFCKPGSGPGDFYPYERQYWKDRYCFVRAGIQD
jgi:hypothetical protein